MTPKYKNQNSNHKKKKKKKKTKQNQKQKVWSFIQSILTMQLKLGHCISLFISS